MTEASAAGEPRSPNRHGDWGADPAALHDGVRFAVHWEGELTVPEHRDIAYTLRQAFPNDAHLFPDARSWAGARPELRLVARTEAGVAGHYAVKRRFLRVDGTDQLVGETGLLAVHPDLRRQGLGPQLVDRMNRILTALRVPFGYTNCTRERVKYHEAAGWRELPGVHTCFYLAGRPSKSVTLEYPAVVLPVTAGIEEWPSGTQIQLNGPEL
jgi:nodulation protein A